VFRTLVKSLCSAVCLLLTLTAVPAQVDPPLYRSPTQYPGFPGLSHGAVVSADLMVMATPTWRWSISR
jgi:hypothetical protein